jgi:hypothetical protein
MQHAMDTWSFSIMRAISVAMRLLRSLVDGAAYEADSGWSTCKWKWTRYSAYNNPRPAFVVVDGASYEEAEERASRIPADEWITDPYGEWNQDWASTNWSTVGKLSPDGAIMALELRTIIWVREWPAPVYRMDLTGGEAGRFARAILGLDELDNSTTIVELAVPSEPSDFRGDWRYDFAVDQDFMEAFLGPSAARLGSEAASRYVFVGFHGWAQEANQMLAETISRAVTPGPSK